LDASQLRYVENGLTSPYSASPYSEIQSPMGQLNLYDLFGSLPNGRLVFRASILTGGTLVNNQIVSVDVATGAASFLVNGGSGYPSDNGSVASTFVANYPVLYVAGTTMRIGGGRRVFAAPIGGLISRIAGRLLPDVVTGSDFPVWLAEGIVTSGSRTLLYFGIHEIWEWEGGVFRRRLGGGEERLGETDVRVGYPATVATYTSGGGIPSCNGELLTRRNDVTLAVDSAAIPRATSLERVDAGECGAHYRIDQGATSSQLFNVTNGGATLLRSDLPAFASARPDGYGGVVGYAPAGGNGRWFWYKSSGEYVTSTEFLADAPFRTWAVAVGPDQMIYGKAIGFSSEQRLVRINADGSATVIRAALLDDLDATPRVDGRIEEATLGVRWLSQDVSGLMVLDGPYLRRIQFAMRVAAPQAPGIGSPRTSTPQAPGVGSPRTPAPQA
jgi:hypothetical protein